MTWAKKFVELDKTIHDRASFDCGEAELNAFIQTKAAKHMEAGISRTMLLPAPIPLPDCKHPTCAFYTIAPGSISRKTLPQKLMKKLPYYPVPVFLIAQLAVDLKYQRQGLGKITLIKALEHLWGINAHMRAYAIIVDCLHGRAEHFYSKYGFQVLDCHNDRIRMFMPITMVEQLFDPK